MIGTAGNEMWATGEVRFLKARTSVLKTHVLLALVGLATGFLLPAFTQQKDMLDPKMEQQIPVLASKYDEAFNRNDAHAVTALYTEDEVYAFHGTSHGRQAIEKEYERLYFKRWNRSIILPRSIG